MDELNGSRATPEVPFSMPSRSLRRKLRCSDCFRLWCLLDETQQDSGRPLRGLRRVEEEMGWQPRTARKHLRHLADVGLLRLEPAPERGGGWADVRFVVAHSPARPRRAVVRDLPGVWEEPADRWHNPSNLDSLPNAGRDAHSITDFGAVAESGELYEPADSPDSERWARRASKEGATRLASDGNAGRDAHSVPRYRCESLPVPEVGVSAGNGGQPRDQVRPDESEVEVFTDHQEDNILTRAEEPPRGDERASASERPGGLAPRDAAPPKALGAYKREQRQREQAEADALRRLNATFPGGVEVNGDTGLTDDEEAGYNAIADWNRHAYGEDQR